MASAPRAAKRRKPAPGDAAEAFARLLASCSRVEQLCDAAAKDLHALQTEIDVCSKRCASLQTAWQAEPSSTAAALWKDQLDAKGTSLWNRSIGFKPAHGGEDTDADRSGVFAAMRVIAYQLICLGAIDTETPNVRQRQLSLASKTACAVLDAGQPVQAESLITRTGEVATALAATDDKDPERVKALLEFYCCRIRIANARGMTPVAHWLKDKATALLDAHEVSRREIEKLASTALNSALSLLKTADSARAGQERHDAQDDTQASIDWLHLALEMAERGSDERNRALQVAVLKALAHALLLANPPRSRWAQAEETLRQVIELDPDDGVARRRFLKLVLARGGSDSEIEKAFLGAASNSNDDADAAYRLVATLDLLPEPRRTDKVALLLHLVEQLSVSRGSSGSQLRSHMLSAAFLQAAESDRPALEKCLNTVARGSPALMVQARPARLSGAAGPGLRMKAARRAVFCLMQAGDEDEARKTLDLPILQEDLAKNHFLRFYTSTRDVNEALHAIQALVQAPDLQPDLLLWAHKLAVERGQQDLARRILQVIASTCRTKGESETNAGIAIDLLVLARSIIRLLVAELKSAASEAERTRILWEVIDQFDAAQARLATSETKDSLLKELTWLYKTAYNLCAQYCYEWDSELATRMFQLVADIISCESDSRGMLDDATCEKLALCRLALLSAQLQAARAGEGGKVQESSYEDCLTSAEELLASLIEEGAPRDEKAQAMLAAGLAIKIEVLAKLRRWSELLGVVQAYATDDSLPLSPLKLVVSEAAVPQKACPLKILSDILRVSLEVLYKRRDVDQLQMASWLRAIVLVLLQRRERAEARKYVENALHFMAHPQISPESEYPRDEADWMAATAWDEGLELFAASSPSDGRKWCDLAVRIAEVVNPLLAQQWRSELQRVEQRFPSPADPADFPA
ncbi:hypothetical protein JCM8202_000559 [Rhodotorula sphaerocarpa]